MSPNRQKRTAVHHAIERERAETNGVLTARALEQNELSFDQLCWMARTGELLAPGPRPLDDNELSSHLFGPSMKTVQLERVEVIERDDEGRVTWHSNTEWKPSW